MNFTKFQQRNKTEDEAIWWTFAVSRSTREVVEAVLFIGVSSLMCLIGIPANILNCVIFWTQGLKDRINVCLFCLSLSDLCYLLCGLVMYPGGSLLTLCNKALGDEYQTKFIGTLFGVGVGFQTTSHLIGVIIAVDRCLCVVAPFKSLTMMKTRVMTIIIVVAVVVFQAVCVLIPLSHQPRLVLVGGADYWMHIETEFGNSNRILFRIVAYAFLGFVFPVFCLLLMTISSIITVSRLRVAITWRKTTSYSCSSQQEALTVMLVTISIFHIVAMTPSVAVKLSLWFIADIFYSDTYFDLLKTFGAVGNALSFMNTCPNFFIYYCRSSRFRVMSNSVLNACRP